MGGNEWRNSVISWLPSTAVETFSQRLDLIYLFFGRRLGLIDLSAINRRNATGLDRPRKC